MFAFRSTAFFLVAFLPGILAAGEDLAIRVRSLEKEIAAARGLSFKEPVRFRIVARPAGAEPGKQGWYDISRKTLFLYDDLKSSYREGVLVHEMVHALQDQHFDLGKRKVRLHAETQDDDAALALAALIEGDATFTMIEVLKKKQPRAAAMLDMPLDKAKNRRNAFLYAQGARYVRALKEKGGWKAVDFAYKFPPRSTAAILNLKNVSAIDLGPGTHRGAFAWWDLLASRETTRATALAAVKGWRGDRKIEQEGAVAWTIAVADAGNAALWAKVLADLPAPEGRQRRLVVRDRRVHFLEAADARGLTHLEERLLGPLRLEIYRRKPGLHAAPVSTSDLLRDLLASDIVCIGESHDSDLHHQVQTWVIKLLHAHDERLGVGMEMFQLPFQEALRKFIRGELPEEAFLKDSEYHQRWGYDWSLYRPILDFCRRNGLPVAALNVPRELTSKISKGGYESLDETEKKQLGPIDFHLKDHRNYWYERLAKMHGDSKASPERKERSYQVMTAWDAVMGRAAADFLKESGLRRLVVLAGSGHIEKGFGIPQRAAARHGHRVTTLGIVVGKKDTPPVTDWIIVVQP